MASPPKKLKSFRTNSDRRSKKRFYKSAEIAYKLEASPNFWKSTFRNHPELCSLLEGRAEDCFNYLTHVVVHDFSGKRSRYELTFRFRPNPYFENETLKKKIDLVESSGGDASSSTPIRWKDGMDPTTANSSGRKRHLEQYSFFTWYNDNSDTSLDASHTICIALYDLMLEVVV
ncbi:hypothetical protein PPYR_12629 [Photinus pyralis]|uniref:Uncharacterized protein n=1 Tax=Photinus pyralis TaxID=7054 RepID=A0A5N4A6W3_PHOPY|nr:protein SET-like [Photinus pyralis]KAB0793009.1 hypothetical protein PPYR_12629 [Photinus pyralis]